MTDKKRNISRSQTAEVRGSEKEQPARSVKAVAREERRAQSKQESQPARRERDSKSARSSRSLMARIRNNRVGRFLLEAYYELRHKVTWPTFEEARNMTIAVILLSAAIGLILIAADYGLSALYQLLTRG